MGQARQRGSFQERRDDAKRAALAEWKARQLRHEEERRERRRVAAERERLAPKFHALPPVLKSMVLAECEARGVMPGWTLPPPPPKQEPLVPRRAGISTLAILAAAIGGAYV